MIDGGVVILPNLLLLMLVIGGVIMVMRRRSAASSPFGASAPPPPTPAAAVPAGRAGRTLVGPTRPQAPTALRGKLDEWVGADLITADEATAVEQYEATHVVPSPSRLPLVSEAIGYLGTGLVIAAVGLVIGQRWDDINTAGRIATFAVPAVVAFAVGWWTGRRHEEPLERLASVLWVLGGAAVAGAAAVIWVDAIHDGDAPEQGGALFIGGIAFVAMLAAYLLRREPLQHLALFATAVATTAGLVDAIAGWADADTPLLGVGLSLFGLAVVWLALGVFDRLEPAILARLLGAGLALFSPMMVSGANRPTGLWLGLGAAVAMLVVGVLRTELVLLLAGALGLFISVPQVALHYLKDTLGASATLAIIGVLLVAMAAGLSRIYPLLRRKPA